MDGNPMNPTLTVKQYAEAVGVSDRTVKRWLDADELPGAYQDARGWWWIPAETTRTPARSDLAPARAPAPAPVPARAPAPPNLDALPSFLTMDQSAALLGISRHAITTRPDYFDLIPAGAAGALVMPLGTLKRIRGA